LVDLNPEAMLDLLRRQVSAMTRPPVTIDDLLAGLGKTVPGFEQEIRTRLALDPA